MTNNELKSSPGNDDDAAISQKSAFTSPLLITALAITGAIAIWGLVDTAGLAAKSASLVHVQFISRGWFIMLAVSFMLIVSIWLALSRYGSIKLGQDDDEPEFSTISWLTMLFAAGMGVGLLFWGSAEPLTHFDLIKNYEDPGTAAGQALFVTNFHCGLHAWAIYALTGLVIAYFGFRRGCPSLIGAPIIDTFGSNRVTNLVGWLSNLLAIVAIAIGVGGSIAMGVFQVKDGIDTLFNLSDTGLGMTTVVFFVLCAAYFPPLVVDLSTGMAKLSNTAMAVAIGLLIFILLAGPTHYLMGGITTAIGDYFGSVLPHGFRTFTFMDENVGNWFESWTLTYMVWWIAWAPFVGVFIARISRGRTIREFVTGVMVVPSVFSVLWFSVFGGTGIYEELHGQGGMVKLVREDVSTALFALFDRLPLSDLLNGTALMLSFIFLVTSVVSAAYVLGMFTSRGSLNPSVGQKLAWGAVLGGLGTALTLSGNVEAVQKVAFIGAIPYTLIILLQIAAFLRTLFAE